MEIKYDSFSEAYSFFYIYLILINILNKEIQYFNMDIIATEYIFN